MTQPDDWKGWGVPGSPCSVCVFGYIEYKDHRRIAAVARTTTMAVRLSGPLSNFIAANVCGDVPCENVSGIHPRLDPPRQGSHQARGFRPVESRADPFLRRTRVDVPAAHRGRGDRPEQDLTGWPSAFSRRHRCASITSTATHGSDGEPIRPTAISPAFSRPSIRSKPGASVRGPSWPSSVSMGIPSTTSTISSTGAGSRAATSASSPSCTSGCIRSAGSGSISGPEALRPNKSIRRVA